MADGRRHPSHVGWSAGGYRFRVPERESERRIHQPRYWVGALLLTFLIVSGLDNAWRAVDDQGLWNSDTVGLLLLLIGFAALIPVGLSRDRRVVRPSLIAAIAAFLIGLLIAVFA